MITTRQYKSQYHILIWIGVLSAIFIGMMEYGYALQGKLDCHWKIYLGLIPYVTWIVMTYLATKPKWFIQRYNVKEMYNAHRILGIICTLLIAAHWYLYFGKAAKSVLGWWGGYTALVAMFIAFVVGVIYLSPWVKKLATSMSHKKVIWLHRLNLVALIAANIHVHGFKRLVAMVPFLQVYDIITYALVIYYLYWMYKNK